MPSRLHASIHLGAHSLRMCVVEVRGRRTMKKLEDLSVPLLLGQETFTKGRIGHEMINETCNILSGYRDLLKSYNLEPEDVAAVATSAVREASNRDTFVDRVRHRTGIRLRIIAPIEETRLVHRLVRFMIGDRFRMTKGTTMILSIGGGGSQIIVFRDGEVVFSETRKVGTVRLREMLEKTGPGLTEDLDFFVTNVAQTFKILHNLKKVDTFVAINNSLWQSLPEVAEVRRYKGCFILQQKEIERALSRLELRSEDNWSQNVEMGVEESNNLAVALTQVQSFITIVDAKRVIVPEATFIDALLIDEVTGEREVDQIAFEKQVQSAALNLGRRYHFHEKHAQHVRDLAVKLFDDLEEYHGLPRRSRLYLAVAALLHDIGWFVGAQGHHKHAAYLINSSEILGLDDDERNIVAQIARYHRKSAPTLVHPPFKALSRTERNTVTKLAAILRLADALDRDLTQSVKSLSVELGDEDVQLTLGLPTDKANNFALLNRSLDQKTSLFEETFGARIQLGYTLEF
jgi:exopolyphosphatase/guanosine-5'-triphosphate,3'-diphosphate pyrophosphatase